MKVIAQNLLLSLITPSNFFFKMPKLSLCISPWIIKMEDSLGILDNNDACRKLQRTDLI